MADHRHKRDANARRTPRAAVIAGPLALLATASVVTLGVLTGDPATSKTPTAAPTSAATAAAAEDRRESVSRSASRGELSSLLSKTEMILSSESTRQAIKNADSQAAKAARLFSGAPGPCRPRCAKR